MNTGIIQKEVTLEAIQSIVTKSISESMRNVAMRDDLKGLATIESVNSLLKGFATRDDLKGLATTESVNNSLKGLATIKSVNESFDRLAARIDDLPTRAELKAVEQRLETRISGVEKNLEEQIDDLAISVKNEFDRVYVKLDEMDEHLVTIENESERRISALQNQLDTIHGQYPNRSEHSFLEKRVKMIEKVVFA
jgi:hypothetical protein